MDSTFSHEERRLVNNVPECLESAVELMWWWRNTDRKKGFHETLELTEVLNRSHNSYSFFDDVEIRSQSTKVMGDVPWVFYDQPKGGDRRRWAQEAQAFVLRYFLRTSDTRQPEAVAGEKRGKAAESKSPFSWCARDYKKREGFGFEQLFYKLKGETRVRRFSTSDRFSIVDQRELLSTYDWVVGKVELFDFELTFPEVPNVPKVSVPLQESQYIVFNEKFVVDEVVGQNNCSRFCCGYGMLRSPKRRSVVAYGPGQFEIGFQLFEFTVSEDGTIMLRLPFVVNRPNRILDLPVSPFDSRLSRHLWNRGSNDAGFGPGCVEASWATLLAPGFDPVFSLVRLVNVFSMGAAARGLCISVKELEKFFLRFHFEQYIAMVDRSVLTWRQVPDWLDTESLPTWVKTGVSS